MSGRIGARLQDGVATLRPLRRGRPDDGRDTDSTSQNASLECADLVLAHRNRKPVVLAARNQEGETGPRGAAAW